MDLNPSRLGHLLYFNTMIAYATVLLYAIPAFVVLVLIEWIYGLYIKDVNLRLFDTISSLSSGISNSIKDSLGLMLILVSYPFLYRHLQIFEIPSKTIVYILAFIAIDFSEYWVHRVSHTINIFWNRHVIHHSSEEFNLPCALRQPVSNLLGIFAIFLIPAAIIGVPHEVILIIAPLHLFLQFWYHTRYIGKLGWLEYIIVTPSQHRVHHAINPEYIDKNLAAIFCIWDRIFGTFQEELDDVPPVYGTLKPAQTWNPFKINFQHVWGIFKDAWRTKHWSDKLKIWFMPTGWRPADVASQYPVKTVKDVYNVPKYNTDSSSLLSIWVVVRFMSTLALLLWLFYRFGDYDYPHLLFYGGMLAVSIYGYTSLMDKDRWSFVAEICFALAGILYLMRFGTWYGLSSPLALLILASYFLSIIGLSIYFSAIWWSNVGKINKSISISH